MKKITINKIIGLAVLICLSLICTCGLLFVSSVNATEKVQITVSVDVGDYNAYDLPKAVEGKTYPVFDCSATTQSGEKVESIEVFVQGPNSNFIKIVDERFATDIVGEYTITYVATYNNVQETASLTVEAVDESEYVAPNYTFNNKIVSESLTGIKINLFDGKIDSNEKFGNVVSDFSIVYTGSYQNVSVDVKDFGLGSYFIPEVSGTYQLTYLLTDIIESTEPFIKEITVSDGLVPIMDEPSFALVGHIGENIVFPTVEAKLYYNGRIVYVPVKVFFDETEITSNMSYTPTVAGEFTVKYVAENVFLPINKTVKEYKVKIYDLDELVGGKRQTYANFFMYLDGFTGAYRDNHETLEARVYVLTADGSNENAKMQFKTPIYTEFLSIALTSEKTMYNFETLEVVLTDSVKGNQKVRLTFKENSENKIDAFINGKYSTTLDRSFSSSSEYDSKMLLTYKSSDNSIYEGRSKQTIGVLENFTDGSEFTGFYSDRAYISVEYGGITGECQLQIVEVAGVGIDGRLLDRNNPYIVAGGYTNSTIAEIGETVLLPKFPVFDLFDANVAFSVKVSSPSGKTVETVEVLDGYEVTVDEYGIYDVTFLATDSSGNVDKRPAVIHVFDRTAPQIIAPKLPTRVKVGATLTLPKATVVDNACEKCTTWIYVTYGDYLKATVSDNKFKFEKAGVYTVKYGAMDADGNYTIVEYTITCK